MIQSAYASFVEVKPAGAGLSKPGKASATTSLRVSCARTRSQTRWVSGTPCTSTAGMDEPLDLFHIKRLSAGGRNQVIETFHELSACERLRDEGGGQEAAQLFTENSKRVRRVDDRLAFPAR